MQTRVPNVLGGRAAASPTGATSQVLRIVGGRLVLNTLPITPETDLGLRANSAGRANVNLGGYVTGDDFMVISSGRLTVNPALLP